MVDDGVVVYVTARQLRARWGNRSHMFIERLLARDESFPRPVRLSPQLRLWRLADIEDWERARAAA